MAIILMCIQNKFIYISISMILRFYLGRNQKVEIDMGLVQKMF